MNISHQKSSNTNAGPSWNKVQCSKNSSGKRQSRSQAPHVSPQLRSSLGSIPQLTEDRLKEGVSPKDKTERRSLLSSGCRGASGNKLFLDFQSMKIMKDTDEDSASDLSDSERVPVPPSPLTPPDLNLRAEEIDPIDFSLHPGQGSAKPEYCYPDFLPPPFNSWDLRDMAGLPPAEHRTGVGLRTGGLLGKYIDRLIQLEWLQIQTVQSERGKAAKARPPTAPGTAGPLKSPGRSKLFASALSRPHHEGASKSGPAWKKDFHHEEALPSYCTLETSSQSLGVLSSSRLGSQKQTLDMRTEEKKKKSKKSSGLRRWDLPCSAGGPRVASSGDIRIPKQSGLMVDSTDPLKASRTPARVNLKKKGNVNNCGHATLSSEKKLKTNGVKQNTFKFKP
nr:protein FAM217B isoform X2 [Manis javanica]XP_017534063.2 protein FAM217B isoform X2 [Manis javanica]XP_017534064.2 protein FAM217B isoform X2 [Manis javanica]XP_036862289.1 protein FAM217B isoform X2 [Manis javanica]XP_036862290.1 protein FAM217B isoform X2 [Manis javanica]